MQSVVVVVVKFIRGGIWFSWVLFTKPNLKYVLTYFYLFCSLIKGVVQLINLRSPSFDGVHYINAAALMYSQSPSFPVWLTTIFNSDSRMFALQQILLSPLAVNLVQPNGPRSSAVCVVPFDSQEAQLSASNLWSSNTRLTKKVM